MKKPHLFLVALLAVLPGLAQAHGGADAGVHHGSAFMAGFVHPFSGKDHMVAMLAVGVWSVLAIRQVWLMPVVFAGLLLVGGLIGFSGITVPMVEPMIATSLLALGLLVGARVQLPLLVGGVLVGLFAVFHGVAHGTELPAAQAFAALSGMVLSTLALHLSGMLLGLVFKSRNVWYSRMVGGGITLLGVSFLTSAF